MLGELTVALWNKIGPVAKLASFALLFSKTETVSLTVGVCAQTSGLSKNNPKSATEMARALKRFILFLLEVRFPVQLSFFGLFLISIKTERIKELPCRSTPRTGNILWKTGQQRRRRTGVAGAALCPSSSYRPYGQFHDPSRIRVVKRTRREIG